MTKCTQEKGPAYEWYASTESEVADIPVGAIGDSIYVVNGGIVYMSDGINWVKQ